MKIQAPGMTQETDSDVSVISVNSNKSNKKKRRTGGNEAQVIRPKSKSDDDCYEEKSNKSKRIPIVIPHPSARDQQRNAKHNAYFGYEPTWNGHTPNSSNTKSTKNKGPNEIATNTFYSTGSTCNKNHLQSSKADALFQKFGTSGATDMLVNKYRSQVNPNQKTSKGGNEVIHLDLSDDDVQETHYTTPGKLNAIDMALAKSVSLKKGKTPIVSKMKPKNEVKKLGEFASLSVQEVYRDGVSWRKGDLTLKLHESLTLTDHRNSEILKISASTIDQMTYNTNLSPGTLQILYKNLTGVQSLVLLMQDTSQLFSFTMAAKKLNMKAVMMNDNDRESVHASLQYTQAPKRLTRFQNSFITKREPSSITSHVPSFTHYKSDDEFVAGPSASASRRLRKSTPTTTSTDNNYNHNEPRIMFSRFTFRDVITRDPNEKMFHYPFSHRSSITIRVEDVERLSPGEFLNDSIIEFYIKWLCANTIDTKVLENTHIFNSFFYQQLSRRNDGYTGAAPGYERVKKWTNKVDIFSKEFIVIPINEHMHWYLAIVHNPGYILQDPVEQVVDPLKLTHDSDEENEDFILVSPPSPPLLTNDTCTDAMDVEEVGQVKQEKDIVNESQPIDYIIPLGLPLDDIQPEPVDSCRTYNQSSKTPNPLSNKNPLIKETIDLTLDECKVKEMSVDNEEEEDDDDESVWVEKKTDKVYLVDSSPTKSSPGVQEIPLTSSTNSNNKRKRIKLKKTFEQEEAEKAKKELEKKLRDDKLYQEKSNQCTIIILDSLGHQKLGAIRNIKEYLKKEAIEKKKVDPLSMAKGTHAKVPLQPNHCDCGVYLLKYFATFMSDPERHLRLVFNSKPEAKDWFENTVDIFQALRREIFDLCQDIEVDFKKFELDSNSNKL